MNILLALIPISMILVAIGVAAFVWAVRRGQYEDLDTPALDILREDPNERIAREREEARRAGHGEGRDAD